MRQQIRFAVGDWSDDGHGKCEYFTVKSDKQVQDVREAHFASKELLGFDIGRLMSQFEVAADDEHIHTLGKLGLLAPHEVINDSGAEVVYLEPEQVVTTWINVLNRIDPALNLALVKDGIPDLHFYGGDSQGRHLRVPGYGCFSL